MWTWTQDADGMLRAQLRSGALRRSCSGTQELEELREEHARLRMDATRPRSLHRAADGLLAVADTVVQRSSADVERQDADQDELDDAWHRLAEARQLRTAVASALSELQVACEQLLSRLELGVGSMEIDRRAGTKSGPLQVVHDVKPLQGVHHDEVVLEPRRTSPSSIKGHSDHDRRLARRGTARGICRGSTGIRDHPDLGRARVLLIGSGASDPTTAAWVAALTNEGVPYTEVDATGTSGAWTVTLPPLTAAGNPNEGLFDAVVIADSPADFAGNELDALFTYESSFGIRQIDGYVYPSPSLGLNDVTGDVLDGVGATLTATGLATFPALKGPVPFDTGTWGYPATVAADLLRVPPRHRCSR